MNRGASDPVAAAIGGWRPRELGAAARDFAREAVRAAAPASAERARALLWAAARLAAFGESVGLEPRAEALLRPAAIERFIASGTGGLSAASARTLRTNLRALARALDPAPRPAALARERAKPPYSDEEIAGYLRLAAAQPTEARRMRASALICLGAGAGIVGAELRQLRGRDVARRSGGLVVAVSGPRARVVPVLARFHGPLRAAAAFAGEGCLVGGADPARRNLTDALNRALSADAALPRLEGGRLRSTWLAQCARAIGLRAFMEAAGVRCSQRLGDLVAELPQADEAEAVALLGGADEGSA
ncbi:MAG: hypothetical protein ACXWZM_07590 [Solirubrobacterales bacterium]